MVLVESAARLAATLLAIVQTRIDLATTEIEEETQRYFSYLIMSMAAMFCIGIAIVLGTFLVVLLYWETNRIGILLTLTALFGVVGIWIGLRVRRRYREKPRMLTHTMQELSRDSELLHPPA